MESPEYRKMSQTQLLEILMSRQNPEAEKSIIVGVKSDDEVDETYDEIRRENLPLKKQMWLWKAND